MKTEEWCDGFKVVQAVLINTCTKSELDMDVRSCVGSSLDHYLGLLLYSATWNSALLGDRKGHPRYREYKQGMITKQPRNGGGLAVFTRKSFAKTFAKDEFEFSRRQLALIVFRCEYVPNTAKRMWYRMPVYEKAVVGERCRFHQDQMSLNEAPPGTRLAKKVRLGDMVIAHCARPQIYDVVRKALT